MKFMNKNKKGFTLVELMIVVVIMAILVAVAVPIFNAVTKNARKRTAVANQRTIVSQINTASMEKIGEWFPGSGDPADIVIKVTANTEDANPAVEITGAETSTFTVEYFTGLFNKIPAPPEVGVFFTITVSTTAAKEAVTITSTCSNSDWNFTVV